MKNKGAMFLYKWYYKCFNRLIILLLYIKAKTWFDLNYNSRNLVRSNLKIDIVIPIIERDLEVLEFTIMSIRKNIMHDINKIYIVAPQSEKITTFCSYNDCIYVYEDNVLPIKKKDIDYRVNWQDRSWWIYQQLLKYWMKDFVESEYFLITESEAIFLQPRVFEHKWKIILPVSSAMPHLPYFSTINKLAWISFRPIYNFTSHHSLFKKEILNELLSLIEKRNNCTWFEAIISILDENENSCISDYETYWQYFYKKHSKDIILEHWFNIDLKRTYLKNYEIKVQDLKDKYKVLSFSRYLN